MTRRTFVAAIAALVAGIKAAPRLRPVATEPPNKPAGVTRLGTDGLGGEGTWDSNGAWGVLTVRYETDGSVTVERWGRWVRDANGVHRLVEVRPG